MSDLISRNAAIERFIEEIAESGSPIFHINTIKRILQDIDIAYDVDKVIEQFNSHHRDYYYDEAIEIVRSGANE